MDIISIIGYGLIIIFIVMVVSAFKSSSMQKRIEKIDYIKRYEMNEVFEECTKNIKQHLPYSIKKGSMQEKIFISEVIFCITCLGLIYPAVMEKTFYSDERNINVGSFTIEQIKSIIGAVLSDEGFNNYYGHRMFIYSSQIKRFFRQMELFGIDYDMERHVDNMLLCTISWILPRLYLSDVKNYSSLNPLAATVDDIVYTHYMDMNVDEYVYDINRAICQFSEIVKDL